MVGERLMFPFHSTRTFNFLFSISPFSNLCSRITPSIFICRYDIPVCIDGAQAPGRIDLNIIDIGRSYYQYLPILSRPFLPTFPFPFSLPASPSLGCGLAEMHPFSSSTCTIAPFQRPTANHTLIKSWYQESTEEGDSSPIGFGPVLVPLGLVWS